MASLCNDPNGHRRILFIDGHGDRRTIRLGKTPKKVAESFLVNIEAILAARTLNTKWRRSKRLACSSCEDCAFR